MSAHHPCTRSALRLARWLPVIPLLVAFACSDGAGPAAPSRKGVSPPVSVQADLYPGTTNTEFWGVQTGHEAFGISIKFTYSGIVTPSFTVGTKEDVLGSQVISVAAKKQAAGYWTAHAGGLDPGKLYYFRLDNMKSTYWGSAKTQRRDVVFDLDSIYVIDDADWGPGCGEWDISARLHDYDGPTRLYNVPTGSFCTGSTYRYTGPGAGVGVFTDMGTGGSLQFIIEEWDKCGLDTNCFQYGYTLLYPFNLVQEGTTKFDHTSVKGMPAEARFWGKLTVKYVTW